jgi:SlyX protein
MTQPDFTERLDKLEILFSEQEFTVDALNQVITRQSRQIDMLEDKIEILKQQIKELRKQMPDPQAIVDEKPPHY